MKASICNPLDIDIFNLVLFLVEYAPYLIAVLAGMLAILQYADSSYRKDPQSKKETKKKSPYFWAKVMVVLGLPIAIVVMVSSVVVCSWEDAYKQGYDVFRTPSLRSSLETYIQTGQGDLHEIIESGKYAPTFGVTEITYLLRDLLKHTVLHLDTHNEDNIDEAYNKGNDWFASTLGPTMMYTSGIFQNGNETLEEAQIHKIDYVADAIELQPGDNVLDIGCGWTYLAKRLHETYGANVTAITLSEIQHEYGTNLNKENDGVHVLLQDAMFLQERTDIPKKFDKITSLEMAEHVGIRRYNQFLKMVHNLLDDDGIFYFQVAGLRRTWWYEDLVWGLFMGEHIFPGADASCPLGWVSTQLEKAGFEIQRVHNLGSHYSKTIYHWLLNWRSNKEQMIETYGEKAYRRWEVFLAWSVRAARQGSSTVFMFTLTKHGQESRRIQSQAHLAP